MKIYLGSDHAGFELKGKLIKYLQEKKYEVEDKGAFKLGLEDDYPDFVRPVAEAVAKDTESRGIIIGGSGQGEAICANRLKGVRAAVFYASRAPVGDVDVSGRRSNDPYEIVKLERMHNNANILSLGARFITEDEAKKAVEIWLETPFSGEERHLRRISKLD